MRVTIAKRHSHIARTPLGKAQARHPANGVCVDHRLLVFQLEPQQQLAIRVKRPRVGNFQILLGRNAPYFGWLLLSASAPLTLAKAFPAILVKRVATLFNEGTNSVGLSGVGVQNPVNSG